MNNLSEELSQEYKDGCATFGCGCLLVVFSFILTMIFLSFTIQGFLL
jgi:hypothetical protein